MKSINNIFTKENYSYLCQDNPYINKHKISKTRFLHIPKLPSPSCENHHPIKENKQGNALMTRKQAIFHQVMVSHRQLDSVLEGITTKENQKKAEPGTILNLNRKKIADIINIYSEVLKFKDRFFKKEGNPQSALLPSPTLSAETPTKMEKKMQQMEKEEIKIVREMNKKLVSMVSENKKRLYGKGKFNQDKAKFLFENSTFFMNLVNRMTNSGKVKRERDMSMKTERTLKEKTILARKRRSVSDHIPSNIQKLEENERILKGISFDLQQEILNDRTGELAFNEMPTAKMKKNLEFMDEFHCCSALNSAQKHKRSQSLHSQTPDENQQSKLIPRPKPIILSVSIKKPFVSDRRDSLPLLAEISEIKNILKEEKGSCKEMRKKLRVKGKQYSRSLNKLDKQLSRLI